MTMYYIYYIRALQARVLKVQSYGDSICKCKHILYTSRRGTRKAVQYSKFSPMATLFVEVDMLYTSRRGTRKGSPTVKLSRVYARVLRIIFLVFAGDSRIVPSDSQSHFRASERQRPLGFGWNRV